MMSAIVSPTHSAELAREQVLLVDDPRQDRHPRRPEEDRDRGDEEDQRVDEQDVRDRRDRDEQDDRGAQEVADDHDLLVVPAVDEGAGDRAEEQVREGRGEEDEAGASARAGRDADDERERELMEPVAEQRDELAGPQRRERAVEGEPDVGVVADRARRPRSGGPGSGWRSVGGGRRQWPSRGRRRRGRGVGRVAIAVGAGDRGGAPATRGPRPAPPSDRAAVPGGRVAEDRGRGRSRGRREARVRRAAWARRAGERRRAAARIAPAALVELLRDADDAGEQEEREAEGQEHVADRGDVPDDRDRDRDDVAERPEMEEEVGVERRRQDVWSAERMSSGGEAGGDRGSAPRSACSRR